MMTLFYTHNTNFMKKLPSYRQWSISLLLLFSGYFYLFAQTPEQITGNWKGAIEIPGLKLEISLHLQQENGQWTGLLDIPVQQIKGMHLDDLSIQDGKVSFRLSQVPGNAAFSGAFADAATWIRGDFSQGGQKLPLNVQKENTDQKALLMVKVDRFRHIVDSFLVAGKVPAVGVAIVQDGEVILADGFGFADQAKQRKADANTLFAIGSSSKAFTATGVAMLVEAGQIEWDKPVINYLPDFKLMDDFATREMTAVDLLSHQSGLPRHDLMWYGSGFSRQEIYERLRYLPPNKSFRSAWQYQNLMYLTAGILIERTSGQSWEDYTRQHIFQPLGMSNTTFFFESASQNEQVATPYRKQEENVIPIPHRDIRAIGPAGSIYSNAQDMAKWVQFHLSGGKAGGVQLLDQAQINKLHSPHKVIENSLSPISPESSSRSYGLGWFTYRYNDLDIVQHGGNIDGFSALVFLVPGKNLGMVFLTNMNGSALPGVLANTATDLFLDQKPIDWYTRGFTKLGEDKEGKPEAAKPVAGTKPSHALADYAGWYEHPGYGKVQIKFNGQQLLGYYNGFEIPFSHWHYDTFRGKVKEIDTDIDFTFYTGKDGLIEQVGIPLEAAIEEDMIFKKLPPDLLSDAAYIDRISGQYKNESGSVEIAYKNGKLTATLPGQPVYQLEPTKPNWFKIKELNGFQVEFVSAKAGEKAGQIKFHQPNGIFTMERQ